METWLHEDITDDLIDIAGYCLHRRDRQDGRVGGGVAVYVRQGLPCILQPQHNDVSFYRSPLVTIPPKHYAQRSFTHTHRHSLSPSQGKQYRNDGLPDQCFGFSS